ncbi:MAG: ZIP family metal transporter [Armatimonadetes bacterium]|nr:ZIP family metal transporter [Armatimonadota bacterium]
MSMREDYLAVIGFSLLASVADMLGGWLAVALGERFERKLVYFIGFGAGFLLSVTVLDIFPEALEGFGAAPLLVVLGYFLIFLFEQTPLGFHAHDHGPREHVSEMLPVTHAASLAIFIGLFIHSFFDGLAIAAAIGVRSALAVPILVGILTHKVPGTFSLSAVLLASTGKKRVAFLGAIGVALATMVGALLSLLVGHLNDLWMKGILAVAAGTFVYVAATELIPTVNESGRKGARTSVLLGAASFFLISRLLGWLGVH